MHMKTSRWQLEAMYEIWQILGSFRIRTDVRATTSSIGVIQFTCWTLSALRYCEIDGLRWKVYVRWLSLAKARWSTAAFLKLEYSPQKRSLVEKYARSLRQEKASKGIKYWIFALLLVVIPSLHIPSLPSHRFLNAIDNLISPTRKRLIMSLSFKPYLPWLSSARELCLLCLFTLPTWMLKSLDVKSYFFADSKAKKCCSDILEDLPHGGNSARDH